VSLHHSSCKCVSVCRAFGHTHHILATTAAAAAVIWPVLSTWLVLLTSLIVIRFIITFVVGRINVSPTAQQQLLADISTHYLEVTQTETICSSRSEALVLLLLAISDPVNIDLVIIFYTSFTCNFQSICGIMHTTSSYKCYIKIFRTVSEASRIRLTVLKSTHSLAPCFFSIKILTDSVKSLG